MGSIMADKRKPTFGAPVDNPLGKNAWRDIHSGRYSCAKGYGVGHGQSDPYIGGYIMPSEFRDPGHRVDRTLPTPLPTKSDACGASIAAAGYGC
jgi:hypothetical protein